MIEQVLWFLVAADSLGYAVMTFTASYHKKKTHHFWKGIPLNWIFAVYYLILVAWLGYALFRLRILF